MKSTFHGYCIGVVICLGLGIHRAAGDEGMWLFNDLPKKQLKDRYQFTPDEAWANHLMRSSVRFNSGGSASFVSSTGLVLTNHHVGADTLQKVSTPEKNYYRDGFCARTASEEIKAPDLELNQLVSVEDVTSRVQAAVRADLPPAESMMARRAAMTEIERESLDRTGLRSDVVTLYGGGRYHLYRYKKYTDVRLVWAPEVDAAFFGGDADNFEYPRYCLDLCLFRVYEGDRPARIDSFLKMASTETREGDLIFVSGNPGRTQRIFTSAALAYQRDAALPFALNMLRRREILLQQFGLEGAEQQRRAREDVFGVQNSRKALTGRLQGLQDPAFFAQKRVDEAALLKSAGDNPRLKMAVAAWKTIEDISNSRRTRIGQTASLGGQYWRIAETLVFMAQEDKKPDRERLREYRTSNRESLLQDLLSPAPIYADLEQVNLADSLARFVELRGGDDPLVLKVLAGKSPTALAAALVAGTQLGNPAVRQALAKGGATAITESPDPVVQLARILEPEARKLRTEGEETAERERQAYAQIAEVLFAVRGTQTYPDATFTLRLSYGTVKGYAEDGKAIPPFTTLDGAFEHEKKHDRTPPWLLPERWQTGRKRLNPVTPFNFVCTADIIGGNSGSPVVNRRGELVGVIFDGNIQSLTADFSYSDAQARAVAVDARALLETLRKLYDAGPLADELGR